MTADETRPRRAGTTAKRARVATTARRSSRQSRVRPLVLGVAVSLTLVVLTVAVARIGGLEYGPLFLAVAATPYALVAGLIATTLALVARHRIVALAALGLTVLLALTQLPLFVGSPDGDSKEHAMTVMTANLGFGSGDPDVLLAAVREKKVDLLAVQELTGEAVDRLVAAGIQEQLPHRFLEPAPGVKGTGVWSRYPLSETRVLPGMSANNLVARVAATEPAPADLTVAVVHPAAPSLLNHTVNDQEHARLRAELSKIPGSVIAIGDFNATFDHMAMRTLRKDDFRNAVEAAGAGYQLTFGPAVSPVPVFGIDHVLLRGPLTARSASTVAIPGSRHDALIVDLVR